MGSKVFNKLQGLRNISFLFTENKSVDKSVDKSIEINNDIINDGLNKLYVIIPYYNYIYNKDNENNVISFIDKYSQNNNIKIYLIEGLYRGIKPLEIPKKYDIVHIKITIRDALYIKENLINIAIRNIPYEWKYLAWIDYNIQFTNNNWINDTIEMLDTNDVIHLYENVVHFNKSNIATHITKSLFNIYNNDNNITEYNELKYSYNYAWACSKKAYDIMDGLIEYNITGNAEKEMAYTFIGKLNEIINHDLNEEYKNKLLSFQERCYNSIKVDNIKGTILNYYNNNNLNYKKLIEGYNILIDNEYSPINDICYTKHNLIFLTTAGKRFSNIIETYLTETNDNDDKDYNTEKEFEEKIINNFINNTIDENIANEIVDEIIQTVLDE